MREADSTLAVNVDSNAGDETVYSGGGDLDIDRNGDGVIDTRDFTAPLIRGDVNFGAGNNDLPSAPALCSAISVSGMATMP